jgi:hypothetical protein
MARRRKTSNFILLHTHPILYLDRNLLSKGHMAMEHQPQAQHTQGRGGSIRDLQVHLEYLDAWGSRAD